MAEADVADLGSIVAAVLAHSPAARVLLAALESEQDVPEPAVRDYYDRNPDRFLTRTPCGAGSTPSAGRKPRTACRTRAYVRASPTSCAGPPADGPSSPGSTGSRWGGVRPGHEHPGDPSHPDHEHRH